MNYEIPLTKLLNFNYPVYYQIRWKIVSILHKRIFKHFTLGGIFFFAIFVALFVVKGYFSKKDVKWSGFLSAIPLIICFTFGIRNSFWTFLVGISFERGLFWHKFFAYACLIMSCFHTWVYYH